MRNLLTVTGTGRAVLVTALLMAVLCGCAPTDDTIADAPPSARVPPELQPVMPAPRPVPSDDPTAPEEDPMDACNANAARKFIGQVATAEVVDQAREAANAKLVRTLKPGQIVTMEYRPNRLNIDVDESNVVINVRCG